MEQIGYIIVGWLLGLLSSLTVRWSDRNQKVNDFINGCYAQLCEIQPRLVGTYVSIKSSIEPLSQDTVKWTKSMLPENHNFIMIENLKEISNILRYQPKDTFQALSDLNFALKKSVPARKGLKKFNLAYLENNLSTISLLENDLQMIIWKILAKVDLINQEIDNYFFYFKNTFQPKVMDTNKAVLETNMDKSEKMISNDIHETASLILELLDNLKDQKNRWTYKIFLTKALST